MSTSEDKEIVKGMVPEVPKVKGIVPKKMLGSILSICQCGNAHQDRFCRYQKKYLDIDERGRKVKVDKQFIKCQRCMNTRPIEEYAKDYKKLMPPRGF